MKHIKKVSKNLQSNLLIRTLIIQKRLKLEVKGWPLLKILNKVLFLFLVSSINQNCFLTKTFEIYRFFELQRFRF